MLLALSHIKEAREVMDQRGLQRIVALVDSRTAEVGVPKILDEESQKVGLVRYAHPCGSSVRLSVRPSFRASASEPVRLPRYIPRSMTRPKCLIGVTDGLMIPFRHELRVGRVC